MKAALCVTAGLLIGTAAAQAAPSLFWLQADGGSSGLGSVRNPQVSVASGAEAGLYLWADPDTAYGFDGISFDIRLLSSDGGAAQASVELDAPSGRWNGTYAGLLRSDSGGDGVDDCNVIDLTNTDTLGSAAVRLGRIRLTGVGAGTVQVFLCIGGFGIVDGGGNALVNLGLAANSTAPESLTISGGSLGLCSSVPEAVLTILPGYRADFDSDRDVDQDDFAHLQECLAGALPQTDPACADALLTADALVDQADVALFQQCFGGPNTPPPSACAE